LVNSPPDRSMRCLTGVVAACHALHISSRRG
jgi:hypothetical protein